MNAAHVDLNCTGEGAASAMSAMSETSIPRSPCALSSRNEPVPAEQALFIA
jgi:hypothetical protein